MPPRRKPAGIGLGKSGIPDGRAGLVRWSHDFFGSRTHGGRKFRRLNDIDAFSPECMAIRIDRRMNSTAAIDVPRPTSTSCEARPVTFARSCLSWRPPDKPVGCRPGVHCQGRSGRN